MLSSLQLVERLRTKPLFTLNQLSLITGHRKSYAKVLAGRLVKKGVIFRVERGKYTAHEDPMLFSSHIVQPSYLTLWTALSFYGLTTQLPREIFVASRVRKWPLRFGDTRINFIRLEPWGFLKMPYRGMEIFVAEKEKLLLDIIATNLVPVAETGELIEEADTQKVMEYSLRTGNRSLIKRVGFLLEEHGIGAENLRKMGDNNYILLIKRGKKKGKRNRRWKLTDNRIR